LQCTGTAAWIDIAVMLGGLPFSRGSRFPSVDMILDKDLDGANQTSEATSLPLASSDANEDSEQQRLTFSRRFSHNSLTSDPPKFKRRKNKRYPGMSFGYIATVSISTFYQTAKCVISRIPATSRPFRWQSIDASCVKRIMSQRCF
jgi:hypothetical protein